MIKTLTPLCTARFKVTFKSISKTPERSRQLQEILLRSLSPCPASPSPKQRLVTAGIPRADPLEKCSLKLKSIGRFLPSSLVHSCMTKKEDKLQGSGPVAYPQSRKSTRAPAWADLSLQLRECAGNESQGKLPFLHMEAEGKEWTEEVILRTEWGWQGGSMEGGR